MSSWTVTSKTSILSWKWKRTNIDNESMNFYSNWRQLILRQEVTDLQLLLPLIQATTDPQLQRPMELDAVNWNRK